MGNKFSLGMYMFAFVMGACAGGCFSKAAYHKGKAEAYTDCRDMLVKTMDDVKEHLDKDETEEA